MEVKSVKAKFSKLAIVMSAVLVLMSAIPVVGMACLFCDEPITDDVVEPIPNTDAVK